jgi:hypothetical protein
MLIKYISLAAALLLTATRLAAQAAPPTPAAPSTTATVRGTVVDSLHGRPLVGASISVDGTPTSAISDSLGRYRIDSVPAGARRLAVYHPLLDSLEVSLYTAPIALAAGTETFVALAVPSRPTLLAQFCGADSAARVLVAGQLLDVDTDTPVAGATATGSVVAAGVVVHGNQIAFQKGTQTRQSKTDADGRFHLCLPDGAHPAVTASFGNSITGSIPLDVATGLAMPAIRIARADSASATHHAVLTGSVQSADGKPIEGATIEIDGSGANTESARSGEFHLDGVPSGTQVMVVRHVGYAETTRRVDVSPTTVRTVAVVLQPAVATLAKVDVKVQALLVAATYDRTGFNRRKQLGVGQFVTADQIATHNSGSATNLLETVPGVRLLYSGRGVRVVSSRASSMPGGSSRASSMAGGIARSCTSFVVDGMAMGRGVASDDQGLPQAHEIIGIEVYQPTEPIAERPPSRCLTILIWTKAMMGA